MSKKIGQKNKKLVESCMEDDIGRNNFAEVRAWKLTTNLISD